jgi:DNA-binding MarR family transcriptional regulator
MESGGESQANRFEKIMTAATGIAEAWNERANQWLRERQVTFTQFKALLLLSEEGGQTLSQLSRGLSRTRCAITGLVDRLEEKGLARRKRSRGDRRLVYVSLTDRGRELAEELKEMVVPEISQLGDRVMGALTETEAAALASALGKLSEVIAGAGKGSIET